MLSGCSVKTASLHNACSLLRRRTSTRQTISRSPLAEGKAEDSLPPSRAKKKARNNHHRPGVGAHVAL